MLGTLETLRRGSSWDVLPAVVLSHADSWVCDELLVEAQDARLAPTAGANSKWASVDEIALGITCL
ncbi:MAG TPA: hypothetical protein DEG88_11410 [Propionibacteriaceae bacterium]|nr:hypothetical protein [Propionibacteriaceae bacterium]